MKELKILYLEDSVQDAELTARILKKAGIPFQFRLVDHQHEYEQALNEELPDLILADHSLFQFNSIEALKIFKSRDIRIPFILVTGAVSEEFAVKILKEGADDYLLKSNLVRLPNAILNALEKCRMEKDLKSYVDNIIANEAMLKEAEHLAHFGSWHLDIKNKTSKWSDEIYRLYGYEPGAIEASPANFLKHVHPEDLEMLRERLNDAIDRLDFSKGEFRIIDNLGQLKHLSYKIVVERDKDKKPLRVFGFNHDISEQKMAEEKLFQSFSEVAKLEKELAEHKFHQQRLITEVTIQAQEKERDELAKELHDNINQILSTVKMFLNVAKDDEHLRKDLVLKSYNNINYAIEEIRKLSQSLICPTLGDIGLIDALHEMTNQINQAGTMKVEVTSQGNGKKSLDSNLELMLYRIVQEQLNNIIKYAQATHVQILLRVDHDEVFMSLSDNGIGFDPAKKAKGIGLKNIRSRVEFYAGRLNIVSRPNQGCLMEISIPV